MRRITLILGLLVVVMAGCNQQAMNPSSKCPGRTVSEALALLQQQTDKVVPLKALIKCRLGYPGDDGTLKESASINGKLWLEPPYNIYLGGQVGMGSQGRVEMGSNQELFWVGIKPELDEFWWGRWDKTRSHDELQINPKAVMEALGVLDLGDPNSWTLSEKEGVDVLTQHAGDDTIIRRVYLDPCADDPHRMEYFDREGRINLVVQLTDYLSMKNGFRVPGEIAISSFHEGGDLPTHWVRLRITAAKPYTFKESFRRRAFRFDRSTLAGYGRITEVTD